MTLLLSRRRLLAVASLAVVAVAVACGGTAETPSPTNTPEATPGQGSVATPVPGVSAQIAANLPADFEVLTYRGADVIGGETVMLSEVIALGKPVALNFFAGLCPPCRAEMPDLQEVYDTHADRFILVGVDVGPFTGLGTNDDGLQLVEDLGVTFPTGSTRDRDIIRQFRVLGMPSTSFIKTDGTVMRKWDGALTKGKMEELVQQLIAASAS